MPSAERVSADGIPLWFSVFQAKTVVVFSPSGCLELLQHPVLGVFQVVPAEVLVVIEAQQVHLIGQLGQGFEEAFPVPGQDLADDEPVAVNGVFEFPFEADGDVLPLKEGVRQVILQVDIGIAAVE